MSFLNTNSNSSSNFRQPMMQRGFSNPNLREYDSKDDREDRYRNEREDRDEEESSSRNEPKQEKFALEKFLGFFDKIKVKLESIWLMDGRVSFLELSFKNEPCHIFVYIQSKYHFTADGSFVPPKYRLVEDDEINFPSDTHSTHVKQYLEKVTEHVKNQPVKLLYKGKKDILMINRHNELEPFNMELPTEPGFYYVTDWETFFKRYKELPLVCDRIDRLLSHATFESQTVKDLNGCVNVAKALIDRLQNFNANIALKNSIERMTKLEGLLQRSTSDETTLSNVVKVRNQLRSKSIYQFCTLNSLGDLCSQLSNAVEKM